MPSDQIGGDNLAQLVSSKANDRKPALFNGRNLFLKLRLFLSSLCATSSSVWVKVTALVHTHLLWSGFKALFRSSWGKAYVFFLLGIQWCTSSRIWLVLFYFRCTVPMRDKEGKQDYRYFFFFKWSYLFKNWKLITYIICSQCKKLVKWCNVWGNFPSSGKKPIRINISLRSSHLDYIGLDLAVMRHKSLC